MQDQTKTAVTILDFVLLMMTVTWIIVGLTRGLDFIEIGYNYLYLITILLSLILNLKLLYR